MTAVVPDTTYTTTIYLAVRGAESADAGKQAVRVYQSFLGRLRRAAPSVMGLRLSLQEPAGRKGEEGVFECWATLRATVPSDLVVTTTNQAVVRPTNAKDAWRSILKIQFNESCHEYYEQVHHTSSHVSFTREVMPGEDGPQEAAAPAQEKPREMIPVKVLLGGQEFNVQIPKGENLLDGVNDKGVDVKWDCKSGVCDTCKVHVVKGAENLSPVTDAEQSMLGDAVKQGYRLSCQVVAQGPCEIKQ